jgi:hypothetical protein
MADTTVHVDEDDSPVHPVSDPVTGTRPVGPVGTSVPGEHRTGSWGTAARWIIFALLALAFFLVLRWIV